MVNAATGNISGGLFGIEATTLDLNNAGMIMVTADNNAAIDVGTVNTAANSGTIKAVVTGGTAIRATRSATVNNSITGLITGDKFGIQAGIPGTPGTAIVNNDGPSRRRVRMGSASRQTPSM
jgi:hypothetical protein